jgi:hypothetical protein
MSGGLGIDGDVGGSGAVDSLGAGANSGAGSSSGAGAAAEDGTGDSRFEAVGGGVRGATAWVLAEADSFGEA